MFHSLQHLEQQFLLNSEEHIIVGRRNVGEYLDIERISADSDKANRNTASLHVGVLPQNLPN